MHDIHLNEKILAAAKSGDNIVLTALLHQADKSPSLVNLNDPLSWAAHNGHALVVTTLLAHGANFDTQDREGNTPLHWAYYQGHKNICALLIDAGANERALNKNHLTPERFGKLNAEVNNTLAGLNKEVTLLRKRVAELENKLESENKIGKSLSRDDIEIPHPPDASRKRIPSSPNIG